MANASLQRPKTDQCPTQKTAPIPPPTWPPPSKTSRRSTSAHTSSRHKYLPSQSSSTNQPTDPNQVFHQTPLSFALVNLKPLLPGHVLICPRRRAARVADLTPAETSDLFLTVRRVGRMVERVFGGSSLNIAVQDGPDAGQSVAHVHTHVIPRRGGDLEHRGGSDKIYEMMDGEEGDLKRGFEDKSESEAGQGSLTGVDNEGRRARSAEEMRAEAEMLAGEMANEKEEHVD